ncbi:MAG: hypothetical protein V4667_03020 [Bacteroidota bacterium]
MKKMIAILILVFLLVLPAKWVYMDIDIANPSKGLFAFLSIIVGFFVAFFLFTSSETKAH